MPLDLNALHESLFPSEVELRFETSPPQDRMPERKMLVWKNMSGDWQCKIQLFGKTYTGSFDRTKDLRVVTKLDSIVRNNVARRTENITNALGGADFMHYLTAPYLKLSKYQQDKIEAALSGADVFQRDVDQAERAAACRAILTNAAVSNHDSDTLKDLRRYLLLRRLQGLGGSASDFLTTRNNTTPADIHTFICFLLDATLHDLGHDTKALPLPEAPANHRVRYTGGSISNRDDLTSDLLRELSGSDSPILDPTGTTPLPEAQIQQLRVYITGTQLALWKFDLVLENVKQYIPINQRGMPAIEDAFVDIKAAATTWMSGVRSLDNAAIFRRAGAKFMSIDAIRKHHIKTSFFGEVESEPFQKLRDGLLELRDYSMEHRACQEMSEWSSLYQDNKLWTGIAFLLAVIDSIIGASALPLCGFIGITVPLIMSCNYGIYLTVSTANISSFDTVLEFIESSRELLSLIPLLLGISSLGGAFYGLCAALLVPGTELAVSVSSGLAFGLVASASALIIPMLAALLLRGLFEAGKVIDQKTFGIFQRKPELTTDENDAEFAPRMV